ncbi:molybdopterin-binding domain-containing protein [Methylorubrum suomiense]|uniref:Formyltransferase/hydrolase complex Fhc subunit B n=1 Tax=Methylorubrum suomiense TaxID=144191 RepID=A0ABQ4UWX4_9HYPH|nr:MULTISPECIES: formyltransferase [Methylobacteriaceae]GJE76755.1 Formyltransferase/hydrolase complex Fhc subunit B [Methylorubrum suomiense]
MAAWVKGGAADVDAAVAAAADLLAAARVPVLAGLNADVAGLRAAYRLAETLGASLDPVAGNSIYAELGALSAGGAMTTTRAETEARADVVLILGNRPWDGDLIAEIAAAPIRRGRAAGSERALLSLGGPQNGAIRHVAYGADEGGLAVSLGHLRAFAKGHLAGEAAFADLARRLFTAQYGVVIYDAEEVGEIGVEMLQGLIRDLNESTRFFSLPLADPFQGRAAVQLSAWTTGQAPRVGFGRSLPEHDPWRFDSARQIASGEADAALWLAALPAPRPDWLGKLPTIAIVGEGSTEAAGETAEIVITVGVPGETVGGALWNQRRGVIAYADATAPSEAETAAGVLARIRDRLIEKGVSC